MQVLGIVGSPRKQGNTDILMGKLLKGCQKNNHTTEKIYLYDYNIEPCIDCRSCKKGDLECVLKDDMTALYAKVESSDTIIFGTPIYWYGPTAKMKLFIDRLRPFIANRKLEGKTGIVVIPSEEGPKICKPLLEMFEMSFKYLGMKYLGEIMVIAYEKGEIEKNESELKRAYELGLSI